MPLQAGHIWYGDWLHRNVSWVEKYHVSQRAFSGHLADLDVGMFPKTPTSATECQRLLQPFAQGPIPIWICNSSCPLYFQQFSSRPVRNLPEDGQCTGCRGELHRGFR